MKFIDTNIFVYAYFIPKRTLQPHELALKEKSRAIIEQIDQGEPVTLCVINLSEIANILRTCFPPTELAQLLETLYMNDNIHVLSVTSETYLNAIHLSKSTNTKTNDYLIALLMKQHHIKEIYTFDKDFKNFPWVKIADL